MYLCSEKNKESLKALKLHTYSLPRIVVISFPWFSHPLCGDFTFLNNMEKSRNRTNSANESATMTTTRPAVYYVRYGNEGSTGTIMTATTPYEMALLDLASKMSDSSSSMDVAPVESLPQVRDLVLDWLSIYWRDDDLTRLIAEYDSEDPNDISRLVDYSDVDDYGPDAMEDLCWEVLSTLETCGTTDTIEELYMAWMGCEMPE